MPAAKQRNEIAPETAAEVLFRSDRICCVCRQRGKPVQLHHIDEDPSHSTADNLAVLCFDCHWQTQIRGGFDRKLDSLQVTRYRQDWLARVEARRQSEGTARTLPTLVERALRYVQSNEESDEDRYTFQAEYPLIVSDDSRAASEVNGLIDAFITQCLQRFRSDAIASAAHKRDWNSPVAWDALSVSHRVAIYTSTVLSLELQLVSYHAGAAHPNSATRTLNFLLDPPQQLELSDLFQPDSDYLSVLSKYCIAELGRQQQARWANPAERAAQLQLGPDDWILAGAGPQYSNFEQFSFSRNGLVIHFDPYQVGSYAEGKYEVRMPPSDLEGVMRDDVAKALRWSQGEVPIQHRY